MCNAVSLQLFCCKSDLLQSFAITVLLAWSFFALQLVSSYVRCKGFHVETCKPVNPIT